MGEDNEEMKLVRWKVKERAEKQGITSAMELARRAGINKNTATDIYGGRATRVDFLTLAKLCLALACKPGDLLDLEDQMSLTGAAA
ncbi:MAG TPA: helix-turn-helix transcriptional regulator [Chloroflexaceae bacterium]|nr:helix-turn-helix transcriptional regulator [Chloroflexaceae bacterium]